MNLFFANSTVADVFPTRWAESVLVVFCVSEHTAAGTSGEHPLLAVRAVSLLIEFSHLPDVGILLASRAQLVMRRVLFSALFRAPDKPITAYLFGVKFVGRGHFGAVRTWCHSSD